MQKIVILGQRSRSHATLAVDSFVINSQFAKKLGMVVPHIKILGVVCNSHDLG